MSEIAESVTHLTSSDTSDNGLNFLWLEITSKCNLTCRHCYADSGPHRSLRGAMQFSDWANILSEASQLGCRQVQFIGGEPTLHPDLRQLIEVARQLNYNFIEVYTNATTLSQKLVDFFTVHNVYLATSFYSTDPVTHDRITKRVGSFDLTVAGIRRAVESKLSIRAGIIETSENMGHFSAAKEFLTALGVKQIGCDRERGIGRGELALSNSDINPMSELCGQCWRGKLCVTASAESYPCVFSRFEPLGDARSGLESILKSARFDAFRRELKSLKKISPHYIDDKTVYAQNCTPDCIPARSCNPCEPSGGIGCLPDEDCKPMHECHPYCSPQVCKPIDPPE